MLLELVVVFVGASDLLWLEAALGFGLLCEVVVDASCRF